MTDTDGLRTAMHAAVDHEKAPADELIRQVMRRHRRRRRHVALAGVAALAALAVAVPAGLGAFGHLLKPARPNQPPASPTLYIYGYGYGYDGEVSHTGPLVRTVTPVNTATGTPGTPIHVGLGRFGVSVAQIVITPDGKTAYVAEVSDTVIPINTATCTPGKPISVISRLSPAIAITP